MTDIEFSFKGETKRNLVRVSLTLALLCYIFLKLETSEVECSNMDRNIEVDFAVCNVENGVQILTEEWNKELIDACKYDLVFKNEDGFETWKFEDDLLIITKIGYADGEVINQINLPGVRVYGSMRTEKMLCNETFLNTESSAGG